jgi:putative flippase GtrA
MKATSLLLSFAVIGGLGSLVVALLVALAASDRDGMADDVLPRMVEWLSHHKAWLLRFVATGVAISAGLAGGVLAMLGGR